MIKFWLKNAYLMENNNIEKLQKQLEKTIKEEFKKIKENLVEQEINNTTLVKELQSWLQNMEKTIERVNSEIY